MTFHMIHNEKHTCAVIMQDENIQESRGQRKRSTKSCPWTSEEDNKLISCIQKMPRNRWKKVSEILGGERTATQCCQRWHRLVNPRIRGSGWSEQQDELLLKLVSIYGTLSWNKVCKNFADKNDVQCRLRYIQIIRSSNPVFHPMQSQSPSGIVMNCAVPVLNLVKVSNLASTPVYYPVLRPFFRVPTNKSVVYSSEPLSTPRQSPYHPYSPVNPYFHNNHPSTDNAFQTRDPRMDITSLLT